MKGLTGILSILFVGVFIVAMIQFSTLLASDNDSSQTIETDSELNELYGDVNDSLGGFYNNVNDSYSSFASSIPVLGEVIQILSVGANWKSILLAPFAIFSSVMDFILVSIFGGSNSGFSLVFTIVAAIVLAYIIFYAWKWIRGGDPD